MKLLGSLVVLALAVGAMAQFTNAGFESGDLSGWTITPTVNGQTTVQTVVDWDIDFGGPLGISKVAQFSVGQVTFTSGQQAGIAITQSLNLIAGTQYTFEFDWSAHRVTTTGGNAQGGVFNLVVDNVALASQAAGTTSSTTTKYGHVIANFTPTTTGNYSVGALITRPFTVPADLFQSVDNFRMTAVPEPGTLAAVGLGVAAMLRRRRRS